MEQTFLITLFILMVVSAVVASLICYSVAYRKNRGAGLWAVLGFMFGWLAVLIIACLPKEDHSY